MREKHQLAAFYAGAGRGQNLQPRYAPGEAKPQPSGLQDTPSQLGRTGGASLSVLRQSPTVDTRPLHVLSFKISFITL